MAAKTPREIIAHLSKEIVAVIWSAEVARSTEDQAIFVVTIGPEEISRRIHSDYASISRLVKVVNLKVDDCRVVATTSPCGSFAPGDHIILDTSRIEYAYTGTERLLLGGNTR